MHEAIQITRVPHNPGNVFFETGRALKDGRFEDSDYFYDTLTSTTSGQKKIKQADPLIGLFATEGIEIVGQVYVYDAHLPITPENDFPELVARFRELHTEQSMILFGDLASDEKMLCSPRVAGKLFREGFRFAMEHSCAAALACVNPKHVAFYENLIGFIPVGYVASVTGYLNIPGVLLYATPETIKVENLRRL